MKIQTLIFALLLQQAGANSFLRSLRRLSEEYFLSYEPVTTVTDHVRSGSDTANVTAIALFLLRGNLSIYLTRLGFVPYFIFNYSRICDPVIMN